MDFKLKIEIVPFNKPEHIDIANMPRNKNEIRWMRARKKTTAANKKSEIIPKIGSNGISCKPQGLKTSLRLGMQIPKKTKVLAKVRWLLRVFKSSDTMISLHLQTSAANLVFLRQLAADKTPRRVLYKYLAMTTCI